MFSHYVLEKTLESPLDCKEIKPINSKGNQPWIFTGRTEGEIQYSGYLIEELNHWKRPWCWERLRAGGEGGDTGWDEDEERMRVRRRGWDGWTASLTQWTWVSAHSGRWWRTAKPGVPQSMGSQRVRHDLATEQQQQFDSHTKKTL